MTTIGDIRQLHRSVAERVGFFGMTPEFQEEYERHLREIADAICLEENIDEDGTLFLPPDTVLGPMAAEKFHFFQSWLTPQLTT